MNRSIWRKFVALGVVLVLGSAAGVLAQETGNVYANIKDTNGNPLPGVTCELSGLGAPRIQVSNAAGEVRWLSLDPGSWALECSLEGFSTVEYPNIDVRVGRNVTLEVALTEAIGEVITVTSESPLLDERKIQTGTSVTQVELETIPTARDPWAILNQTPGVMVDRINVGGAESGQQSVFTGPGVSDDENTFMVDGVEMTDMAAIGASPTYFDFDQYTEMQFETGGSDVTKSAAGVSVNLVTKRGTNEFRGSARFMRTDDSFFGGWLEQDVPVYTQPDDRLGPTQESFVSNSIDQVTEYGFEAGGPVVRDRLWFWGSFGTNDIRNRTGGATQEDVQNDDTILENTAIKANWQIVSANSLVASWNNGDKKKFGRNASPTRPRPTAWNQRGPTAIYKVEDTHVFSSSLFLGGTWSRVDGGFSLTCIACSQGLESTPETAWGADGVWQNSFLSGPSSRPSEEFKIDGSYFFNTGGASHELKFGGRMRQFETVSTFHWPGRDIFTVDLNLFGGAPDDEMYVVAHRGETPLITADYTSGWVQDTIQLGNFTINAGLRYDLQEGTNEAYEIAANPAFPEALPALAIDGYDGGFDWSDIQPRLGVTYALGAERKTLLRASLSQFVEQLQTGNIQHINPLGDSYAYFIYDDVNQNLLYDAGVDQYVGFDGCTNCSLGNSESVSPNRTDSGLSAPTTQEVIIGAEHALLPEFVLGASYTYRNTTDSTSTLRQILDRGAGEYVSTRADFTQDGVVSGPVPNGSIANEPTYAIDCGVGCRTGGTYQENTDRDVEYSGINLYFTKRLSNQWMLRGYVNFGEADWSLGQGYTDNYDPNRNETVAGSFDGSLYAVQAAGSGAKQDVFVQSSWQWNLNGMYQVAPDRPWGFNVAANLFGREGTPLPYYQRSTQSDGISRDLHLTGNLDDFRTEDIFTTDLRLEKEFSATGNVGFTFAWDIFNIFDDDFELQRRRQSNTSQYDWLTETLSPRIHRLSVRLNWR